MLKIAQLDHVGLVVGDLDKSLEFRLTWTCSSLSC
jgi:hypothetical protein